MVGITKIIKEGIQRSLMTLKMIDVRSISGNLGQNGGNLTCYWGNKEVCFSSCGRIKIHSDKPPTENWRWWTHREWMSCWVNIYIFYNSGSKWGRSNDTTLMSVEPRPTRSTASREIRNFDFFKAKQNYKSVHDVGDTIQNNNRTERKWSRCF